MSLCIYGRIEKEIFDENTLEPYINEYFSKNYEIIKKITAKRMKSASSIFCHTPCTELGDKSHLVIDFPQPFTIDNTLSHTHLILWR